MKPLEYCIECNAATLNAGKDDDSLYVNHKGPYCDDCYREQLIERNEDLEIMSEAKDTAIRIQQEENERLKEEIERYRGALEKCITAATSNSQDLPVCSPIWTAVNEAQEALKTKEQ